MVDVDVVTNKLAELTHYLDRIRAQCPDAAEDFEDDQDALEIVCYNLILALQACLDIASHLIADEGWASAPSLAESFTRLGEHGALERETARELASAAGMRNILVHSYSRVDPALVHGAATSGLGTLERFRADLGRWLVNQQ